MQIIIIILDIPGILNCKIIIRRFAERTKERKAEKQGGFRSGGSWLKQFSNK